MKQLQEQLSLMGFSCDNMTVFQKKDGIIVARVASNGRSLILKYFDRTEHRREIGNYAMLAAHRIPTLPLIATTDRALLLEDIAKHPIWRLGRKEDLHDPAIARKIAVWYRQLHNVDTVPTHLYDPTDDFTLEHIALIKKKTDTAHESAWAVLEENFYAIYQQLATAPRTLVYNDFYYTNLAVAEDTALMFDYNLLGRGYAYSDLRNVISSLSPAAAEAFLEAYGPYDAAQAALDDVINPVITLHLACQRPSLPPWAIDILRDLPTYPHKIARLLAQA